jgi:hypothetical protein
MSTGALLAERSCWSEAYSLAHCDGYRVVSPDGPIGFVEEIETGQDGRPEALLVRVGEWFSSLVPIPLEVVESIDAIHEQVFLGPAYGACREEADRQRRLPSFA